MTRPIIVIGAARSGTKLLRGLIAAHPALVEVPHDMNYVWKFGNYGHPDDALSPRQLQPRVRKFIRRELARSTGAAEGLRTGRLGLVEKTVGNCLRVSFVHAVFPDALFVHLVRDGRDVVESARRMWTAPPEWRRLAAKLPSFPLRAAPRYAAAYARNYIAQLASSERRAAGWGPVFPGMDSFAREHDLVETCAKQWHACVETASRELNKLPPGDVVEVRYEQLVREPDDVLGEIGRRLGIEYSDALLLQLRQQIDASSIGKWRRSLEETEIEAVDRVCGDLLVRLGYAREGPG